jgi:predicted ATPase
MIRQIILENFQGFKGKQSVTLAPITLIFGPNSTGKSSIARAMHLMSAQFELAQENFGKTPTDSKGFFNEGFGEAGLRTTLETIYGGTNSNSKDALGYGWAVNFDEQDDVQGLKEINVQVIHELNWQGPYEDLVQSKSIEVKFVFEMHALESTQVFESWPNIDEVTLVSNGKTAKFKSFDEDSACLLEAFYRLNPVWGAMPTGRPGANWKSRKHIEHPGLELTEIWEMSLFAAVPHFFGAHLLWGDPDASQLDDPAMGRGDHWPSRFDSIRQDEFLDEGRLGLLAGACEDAYSKVRTSFEEFRRVPSIRPIPAKAKISEDKEQNVWREFPSTIHISQEMIDKFKKGKARSASEALLKLTDGRYSVSKKEVWIEEIGIKLEVNQVRDNFAGVDLTFQEVGTGISQVYPVLEAIYAGGSLVYVEQPELHLHPRMQGALMDMVIENWIERPSNQLVLETHSESMLLRLQKRIREGVLDRDSVSILYVDTAEDQMGDSVNEQTSGQKHSAVRKLELDDAGDVLDPFPVSFASLRLEDLL